MVNRDGHTRHWLDFSDQRGIRYEKGACRTIENWLDDYTAAHPYAGIAVELLWSDRIQDPGQTKW